MDRLRGGADLTADLAALRLDAEALEYLGWAWETRRQPGGFTAADWEAVAAILVDTGRRALFATWRAEEATVGHDAGRAPLRRPRGLLCLAVLRPSPRRSLPLRRPLAAAVDLDLPHARNRRRALARRPPRWTSTPTASPSTARTGATALLRRRHRPPRSHRDPAPLADACSSTSGMELGPAQIATAETRCNSPTAVDREGRMSSPLLPASYLDAHRYDGAVIQHARRDRLDYGTIQPRDVALIAAVRRHTFLTEPQVLELWWPRRSPRAGRRRLQRLFRAGHLERFRPIARRASFLWTYHLGERGHRLLQDSGLLDSRARYAAAPSTTTASSYTNSSSMPGRSPAVACSVNGC